MRPINRTAAMGLSSAPGSREEISQPAAFGRPTLHLNAPVTIPRRTKTKYIHATLDDKAAESAVHDHFQPGDHAGRVWPASVAGGRRRRRAGESTYHR